jgi:hypothetical protein
LDYFLGAARLFMPSRYLPSTARITSGGVDAG